MINVHWANICYRNRKYRIATFGDQDTINRALAQGRFYEEDLLTAIAEIGREGIYVDVGTHIGNHALFFAKECPSTRVIGFEPWRTSYELAVRTMKVNGVENKVCIINRPVSSIDGSNVTFVPPPSMQNTGIGHTEKGGDIASVSVDATLERVAKTQAVALIKVDVEGSEMEVLRGASRTIERWRPVLVIETKTHAARESIDRYMIDVFNYQWAGRYCATPTHLYKPCPLGEIPPDRQAPYMGTNLRE